jgi:hypothetical protein
MFIEPGEHATALRIILPASMTRRTFTSLPVIFYR